MMTKHDFYELQKQLVNLRFGQFIHFNSGTEQFNDMKEISDWEDYVENGDKPRKYPFDPKSWNPYKLDCSEWARATRSMGGTFGCLTAKHHEGFCIWNSETTDHCVKNATFKADVVKEYLDAYRKEGLVAGLYFSMLDLTRNITKDKCTREDVEFTKAQMKELLTNYGEIPFIVIDGWQAIWGGPSYKNMPFEEMDEFVKSIQPKCLLINHSCEESLEHSDVVFYENRFSQNATEDFCGPGAGGNILTNSWFWRASDPTLQLQTAEWAIDKVTELNEKNVTFLLNISPNKYGTIDQNVKERLSEIGKLYKKRPDVTKIPKNWMKR